jgi:hypothetical protein
MQPEGLRLRLLVDDIRFKPRKTMTAQGLRRTLTTAGIVIMTALTGCGTTSALAGRDTPARSSVCADVSNCRVVSSVDVDGDGRPDQVAWRQLSQDAVQIRVRTATGKLLVHRVDVHLWWGGGAWGGAARVDGPAGAELFIGSIQGAHTPMYTMLTYRAGALVVEASPGPLSQHWQIDAAWADYMGWWRHVVNGHAAMTQRIVLRVDGGHSFAGHSVTYVWNVDHWVRTTRAPIHFPTAKAASAIGGFQVKGLDAFPGLR